jgi:hypothetical protein
LEILCLTLKDGVAINEVPALPHGIGLGSCGCGLILSLRW